MKQNTIFKALALSAITLICNNVFGQWTQLGTAGFTTNEGFYPSIAIDQSTTHGTVYLAYADEPGSTPAVTVMKYSSSAWSAVTSPAVNGSYESLAIGTDGSLYLAYTQYGGVSKLMKYNGTTWSTLGSAGATATNYTCLALDSVNTPYVAYVSNRGKANVAKYNGTSLVAVGSADFSSSSSTYNTHLVISHKNLFISYQDGTGGKATVMENSSGAGWAAVGTAQFSPGSVSYLTMAVDGNGVPYVAYSDGNASDKLTVQKYNGTSWVAVGTAGFTSGTAYNCSLIFNSTNQPIVSYEDDGSNCSVVKFDGTNWVNVGTADFTAGDVSATSLALDKGGNIYIGYRDEQNSGKMSAMSVVDCGTVTFTATVSANVCRGSSTSLTASGVSTYTWSPSTGLNVTTGATVSASPTATTTYTIVGTNSSGCTGSATSTVNVFTVPTVTGTATPSTICSGSSSSIVGGGGNPGSYRWSPAGSLSSTTAGTVTASPTVTTTYTVTASNALGCSGTGTTVVTVNASPTVSASTPSAFCRGGSASITASGATSYTWSPNTNLSASTGATVTASPTTTTTYTVTGTNASSCTATATSVVTVNALPTDNSGSDQTICNGGSIAIGAASTVGHTYSWSPSTGLSSSTAANPTANPTTTTTYTLTETITATGCSASNTTIVTVNPLPADNSGSNQTICNGGSIAIGAASTVGHTYSWSPSTGLSSSTAANPTANPTATTTYTLTETITATTCSASNTTSVMVNALPTDNSGSDQTICNGGSIAIGAASTVGHTYSWSPSTGLSSSTVANPNANPTATTTYTLTETITATTCSASNTTSVTVNALPAVTVNSLSICPGAVATLTASGANTYSWSNAGSLSASTGASVTTSTVGNYVVTGTAANGCTASANSHVAGYLIIELDIDPINPICRGGSASLNSCCYTSYRWSPATNLSATTGVTVTASPTISTTYTLIGTDNDGCTSSATVGVTVNTPPTISATTPTAYCVGGSTSITASGASTYIWTPATNLSATTGAIVTANPTVTTIYAINGTDANGCTGTTSKTVTVNTLPTPAITAMGPTTFCSGNSVTLTGNGTALSLNGTNNYVITPDLASYFSTTSFTIEVWFKPTGAGVVLDELSSVPTVNWTNSQIEVSSTGVVKARVWNLSAVILGTATMNTWNYAAIRYNSGTSILDGFVNGVASSTTVSGTRSAPQNNGQPQRWALGATDNTNLGNGGYFPGQVDEMRIWSTSLSNTQITSQWNTSVPTNSSNLIAYYKMNDGSGSTLTDASGHSNNATLVNSPSWVNSSSLPVPAYSSYSWSTGGTAYSLSATTGGVNTVTVTDANGCSGSTSTTVTVNSNPSVSVNSPSICNGASATLTASGATTYTWSPNTNLSASTGTSVTANPTTTTTYTVIGSNASGCTSSATSVVTVNALPVDNSGSDQTICNGGSIAIGATSSVGHTYSWSPSTGLSSSTVANPTANPTTTTTYTLTETITATTCSASNTTSVTVNALPVDNSGSNQTICNGGSIAIGAALTVGHTYSWSPSTGLSSSTVANPTANPTATTTYTLTETITATTCSASNTTSVTVNALPTDNSGSDQTICNGGSIAIGAASTVGHTYSWSPSTGLSSSTVANPTANPTATTTYTLTETITATTCSASNTTSVTVNALPTDNSGSNQTICNGGSIAIGAALTVGHTYSWSPSTGLSSSTVANPTANPTATTTYTLTETITATTCSASNTTSVTVNALPIDNSGANQTICNGGSIAIGAALTVGHTYSWSPATGLSSSTIANPTANPTTTTTYTLTETITATTCSASNTTSVTVNALPTDNSGSDQTICNGGSIAIGAALTVGHTYSWSPATGLSSSTVANPTANPTATTTYTLTETITATTCSASNTTSVTVNALPIDNSGSDQTICNGGSIAIGAASTVGHTYSWSPATGLSSSTIANPTANPTTTTTYTLTETITATTCSAANTTSVTVNALPTDNSGSDQTICNGGSIAIGAALTVGHTYSWSPSTGLSSSTVANPTANPTTTTTYTLTETITATTCSASNTTSVTVNALPTDNSGSNQTICNGGSIAIGAALTVGHTYSWTPSTGLSSSTVANPTANPTATTTYTLTETITATTCSASNTTSVTVNALPTDNSGSDQTICNGGSIAIGAALTVGHTYSWSPSTGLSSSTVANPTANPTATTTYTLTETITATTCSASNTTSVTVNALPIDNSGANQTICNGGSIAIGAALTVGHTYSWSPSTGLSSSTVANPTANPTATTTYTLTETITATTCSAANTTSVTVNALPIDNSGSDQTICNGGSIAIGAALTVGHTYSWSPSTGLSSSTVANPTANPTATTTYTLTETITATTCSASNTTSVTVNALPIDNSGANQTICNGGSIAIGAALTVGHTYSWSPATGLSSSTIANPTANPTTTTTYTLTETITATTCSASNTTSVTVNALPTDNSGSDQTICNGGSIAIGAALTVGHTYSWSPATGLSSSTVANPTANPTATTTYTLTETITATTCSASNTTSVTVNALPVDNSGSNQTICNGGSIAIGAALTVGHTYSWSPATGLSSSTAANPTANPTTTTTYTLTETITATTCSISNTTSVTVNALPSNNVGSAKTICNGSSTTIGASSTVGHTYSWNPSTGLSSSIAANPTANPTATTTYTLTETITATTCSASNTTSVTVNALPSNNVGSAKTICNGSSTTIGASSTIGHTYSWSPSTGLSSSTAANPTANPTTTTTYTLTETITATTCSVNNSVILTVPTALTATTSQMSVPCNGGSNGSASVNITGGTGPYTYSWSPSGGTLPTASGLTAGNYTLTGTDANECIITKSFSITEPTALAATTSQMNIPCNGGSNGSASVNITGGTGPYTYSWSPSGGTLPTTSGLTAGNYTLTGTDANECQITKSFSITQPTALAATTSQMNIPCNGGSNGSASVNITGGTGPYTYSWSPSGGTLPTASGLTAGNYTLTGTDANECIITKSFSITEPTALAATTSQMNIPCNGGSNGSASVNITGGTGPYTYSWSPSGGTLPTASGLTAGNYTLTGTDANECIITKSFSITEPTALAATTSQMNVPCNGGSNGSASVNITGGTGPYTYSWSPSGGTLPTASGLTAGNYTLTGTDANECIITKSFSITEPTALAASTAQANVTCNGGSNGSASVNITGGTGPYTYSWSPSGGTLPTASGLTAGNYTLTGTDANECIITKSFSITEPTALTATTSQMNVPCNGGSNGSASVNITGGTGPYTYSWSPAGGTLPTASGLTAGNYTLTGTDANECIITKTFTITQPTALAASTAQANVTCNSGSNGSASVNITGGTGPYTYSWSPSGGTLPTASGLTAGNYTLTGTDANECIITKSFSITQPTALAATTSQANVTCNSGSNGSASVNITGGTGPYTYSWSPSGGTLPTASGLTAGNYTLTGTDANECIITKSFSITQPTALAATTSQANVTCNGGSNGSASVNITGGTGSYTYSWSPSGGTLPTASGLTAGNYTLTGTDANECIITKSFSITEPTALTASTSQINVSCNGGSNGSASVNITGGTGSYTYTWSPSGGTLPTASGLTAGNYTLTGNDANECIITKTFTITQPTALTATTSQTNVTCNGGSNGSASVSITGGTGPYTYSWSPSGGTLPTASSLVAGNYTLTGTDANECVIAKTFSITQAAAIVVTASASATTVCLGTDITLTGTGAISYAWNNNVTDGIAFADSSTKTYHVIGTDGNGCTGADNITVTVNTLPIVAAHTTQSVVCLGTDITLSGTGATSYAWNNNVTDGIAFADSSTKTYHVIGTDGNGCTGADNITVTVNELPIVAAHTTQSVVCLGTDITLTGTGAISYAWNNNVTDGIAFADSSTKTYHVIGTDGNGCTGADNITVTVNTLPIVAAHTTQSVVCLGTDITLSGTGATSYAWNNNVTDGIAFADSSTKTYHVIGTDGNGCTGADNITVTVNELPIIVAHTTQSVVCLGTDITLTGSGATSYTWNNNVTDGIAFADSSTKTYHVIGTDGNGCTGADNITVTVNELPIVAAHTTQSVVCLGTDITLTGTGATSYAWNNNVTDGIAFADSSTKTYHVIGTDGNGCTGADNITVTVNELPIVAAHTTQSVVCLGTDITLSGSGATSYTWNNNVTDGIAFADSSTKTYHVIGTDGNGCTGADNITVTVNTLPIIAAHTTQSVVCLGTDITLSGSGATSYTWNNNVTDGIAFADSSTKTYHVIGTDGNGCTGADNITVTVNTLPIVAAHTTQSVVCLGTDITLSGTGATSYAWNNNVTDGIAFADSSTKTYHVIGTDGNGCTGADNITVTVNELPIIVAHTTQSVVCLGTDITLTGSGATSYTWNNNVTDGIAFADSSTKTYHVIGTDGNGCTGADNITVTVNELPIVAAHTTQSVVCLGTDITLTGTGATSYAWNNNVTDGIAFADSSTKTYHVIGTDGNGCTGADNITVTVNELPIVAAHTTQSVVCLGTDITLSGSGATSYTWNNNVTDGIAFADSSTKTYHVIGTDGNGCTGADNITVTVNTLPIIAAHTTQSVVCLGTDITLSGSGATSYTWNNNVTDGIAFADSSTKTYHVIGTDGNGCTGADNITVTVNTLPIVAAHTTQSVVCLGTDITLTGTGATSYAWNNNVTDGIAFADSSTKTYHVIGTDGNGCTGADNITVTVNELPIVAAHTTQSVVCLGTDITLSGTGATSYAWNNNVTDGVAFADSSTKTYHVIGTDGNGCTGADNITVTVNELPIVAAHTTQSVVCLGTDITLSGSGATLYTWNNNVTDGIAFADSSTKTYHVIGTDGNGCTGADNITVTVNTLPIVAAHTTQSVVCLGTDITLTGTGATSYAWNNNVTDGIAFADSSTKTYHVIGTDGNGCTGADNITVTVNELPIIVAHATQSVVCLGTDITLTGTGATSYAWNNNVTDGIAFADSSTKTYHVIGTDGNGCTGADNITVTVNELPIVAAHTTQSVVCLGTDITLTGTGATSYAWNNNVTDGIAFADSSTKTYHVIGTDGNGCTGADNITVTVNELPIVVAHTTQSVVCLGTDITLSGSGATSYTWNNNVTDGIAFADSSTKTYHVIGTDGNGCTGADNITVTVNTLPEVKANATSTAVCNGGSTILSGSGAASYAWDNNITNGQSFVPTSTLTYHVTGIDSNNCVNSDSVTVFINTLPNITATTSSSSICKGGSIILTGNNAQTYTWDNNVSDGISFAPLTSRTYHVIGTDGNGCTGAAEVTVMVNNLPMVRAIASSAGVCKGSNVTLTGSGAQSYTWDNSVINAVAFVPSLTRTYHVTGTDVNGCTGSSSTSVIVYTLPIVKTNSSAAAICQGGNVTLMGSGASTYTWNNNVVNNIAFTPLTTKLYTVIGSDIHGCTASGNVSVVVYTNPVVVAHTSATAICSGANVRLIATGATTYAWDNNVVNNIPFFPIATKDYSVIGTDMHGCTGASNITVTVNSLPVVSANASADSVCKGSSVTLVGGNAKTYLWNNGVINGTSFVPASTKSYRVIGTDLNGCTGAANIIVTVNSLPIVTAIASSNSICAGSIETLTGSGAQTYVWNNNVTNGVAFTPAATNTYKVTGTDGNGCTASASTAVTVHSLPAVTANASATVICPGSSTILTGSGATSYKWNYNIINGTAFVPVATTTYQVTGTDANGCSNSDSIVITVNHIPTSAVATAAANVTASQATAGWDTIAAANTYYLDVATDNSFAGLVAGYNNLNVGNTTSYGMNNLQAGTDYYYRVRAANDCGTGTNSNVITFRTASVDCNGLSGGAVSPAASVICPQTTQQLTISGNSPGAIQWQVSDDNITWNNINGATAGTYTTAADSQKEYYRSITISNGCPEIASATALVNISVQPVVTITAISSTSATITWAPYAPGQYSVSWTGAGKGNDKTVTTNNYTISGLTPNTDLQVRVTPLTPLCSGVMAGIANSHTLCAKPVITSLSAAPHAINASWTTINGASSYRIYYRDLGASNNWSFIDTTGTSKTIMVPAGGKTYAVYVAANNCPSQGMFGEGSDQQYVTTTPLPSCSAIPVVTATSGCPNQVTLNITGGSGSYSVRLREVSPIVNAGATYKINGSTASITLGNAYAGSVWEVYASSVCSGDLSPASNIAVVTIKPACAAVSNVVVSDMTCTGFSASWNPSDCGSTGISGYQLMIRKKGDLNYSGYNVDKDNNFDIVNWLQGNTTYEVAVRTVACNNAVSNLSLPVTAATLSCSREEQAISPTTATTENKNESVVLYPNPAQYQFSVDIGRKDMTTATVKIEILNPLGQVMQTSVAPITGGHLNQIITLEQNVASGLYFVRTTVGDNIYVNRVVVNKQ